MRVAYARVSTTDQSLALQRRLLDQAGYDCIFEDHGVSGSTMMRPGYLAMREILSPGDSVIVWRLDRFGRSLRELVDQIYGLHDQGINFVSLSESINLDSPIGELTLGVLASVAAFERALIAERTRQGLVAAKERGSLIGRPQALDGEQFEEALFLLRQGMSVPEVSLHFGICRSTLYKYLRELRRLEALAPA